MRQITLPHKIIGGTVVVFGMLLAGLAACNGLASGAFTPPASTPSFSAPAAGGGDRQAHEPVMHDVNPASFSELTCQIKADMHGQRDHQNYLQDCLDGRPLP